MTLWAVLAGGRGRRYGLPKIGARFGGETFLDLALVRVRQVALSGDLCAVAIGVTVGSDQAAHIGHDVLLVHDSVEDPGPAHSIGRLAEIGASTDNDVVIFAVDMLSVTTETLRRISSELEDDRSRGVSRVLVARANGRPHWVLCGVPRELCTRIAASAESVSAVQALFQLCDLGFIEVGDEEVVDVNTPDRLASLPLFEEGRLKMGVQEISIADFRDVVARGGRIIDVREIDEYLSGHVSGAISVPLSELAARVDAFSDDETNYLICQAGGRSLRACEYLESHGKTVVNVAGGTGAWMALGNDVVVGDSPS